jgi:hypothetical protein
MPRYLSLFKYTPAVNWSYLTGQFREAITAVILLVRNSLMLVPTRQLLLVKATVTFSEITAVELLTAIEIDRGLGTWGLVAQAGKIMS